MHPDTMRLIDRWVGIPLCFFASFWPWNKYRVDSSVPFKTGTPPPSDIIVFIGIAEIGALVVAYPAIEGLLHTLSHTHNPYDCITIYNDSRKAGFVLLPLQLVYRLWN